MSPFPYQNAPSSNPYAYQPVKPMTNWPKIVLIALGVLIFIAAVYVGITYLTNKVQESSNGLNINITGNNNQSSNGNSSNLGSNPVYECANDTYNCGNFTTRAQAQQVLDYCTQQGKGDIHQLDKDGNGKACESLPAQ